MIKAFIFDFYGVVCNDIGSEWYKNRPPAETVPELKSKYDRPSDSGEITENEFFDGIGEAVGASGQAVRKEWLSSSKINTELIKFIKEIGQNHKIALCSNTTPELFRKIMQTYNIMNLFDTIVASSEAKIAKPSPDIFHYTLKKLGVKADEAIFIDDRRVNCKAAEAVGIKSFVFQDVDKLRKDLNKT